MQNKDKTSGEMHSPTAHSSHSEIHPSEAGPHQIEEDVQRKLLSYPELQFSSLVIRRIPDGVCLEGVLEVEEDCPDIGRLARSVSGVREVLNHLVIRKPPAKG